MRQKKLYFVLWLFTISSSSINPKCAVTNADYPGRLGDQLLLVIKTMSVAQKYNLPFLLRPFLYSDQLKLDAFTKPFTQKDAHSFKTIKTPVQLSDCHPKNNITSPFTLFKIHYSKTKINMNKILQDKSCVDMIKQMLQPKKKNKKPDLPKNMISVAVHVRKGGGHDLPLYSQQLYNSEAFAELAPTPPPSKKLRYADIHWPTKFPPDQYYIDSIKKISELLDHCPLYFYIFTDHPEPLQLVEKYKKELQSYQNFTFSCHKEGHFYTKNVLKDLFSMTRFDCLIRSNSNFATVVDIIGDFKIKIMPGDHKWVDKTLVVKLH